MSALFTKFDAHAFLENEKWQVRPAKLAKAAKAEEERSATLATLAALADHHVISQNSAATQPEPVSTPANVWSDADEERAAIAEYEGGAPRVWAEALARLAPARPPGDVPPRRWVRFIDDCGRFVDDGWAHRAEVLGWGPLHLFGCDRERPWARIDHAGLIWLLDGHKIFALTADTAVIETAAGARQTYRRLAIEADQVVLAWELE